MQRVCGRLFCVVGELVRLLGWHGVGLRIDAEPDLPSRLLLQPAGDGHCRSRLLRLLGRLFFVECNELVGVGQHRHDLRDEADGLLRARLVLLRRCHAHGRSHLHHVRWRHVLAVADVIVYPHRTLDELRHGADLELLGRHVLSARRHGLGRSHLCLLPAVHLLFEHLGVHVCNADRPYCVPHAERELPSRLVL